jgi:hypothetical protein
LGIKKVNSNPANIRILKSFLRRRQHGRWTSAASWDSQNHLNRAFVPVISGFPPVLQIDSGYGTIAVGYLSTKALKLSNLSVFRLACRKPEK